MEPGKAERQNVAALSKGEKVSALRGVITFRPGVIRMIGLPETENYTPLRDPRGPPTRELT